MTGLYHTDLFDMWKDDQDFSLLINHPKKLHRKKQLKKIS